MNEKEVSALLHDYVRGGLNAGQRKEIESAIASSESLKQEFEQVRAYYAALDEMEPVRASGDFMDGLHRRMQAETTVRGLFHKLFFPLHVKLPLEALGVSVTVLLVFMLYAPYVGRKLASDRIGPVPVEEVASRSPAAVPEKQSSGKVSAEEKKAAEPESRQAYAMKRKMLPAAKSARSTQPEPEQQPFTASAPPPAIPSGAAEQVFPGNGEAANTAAPAPLAAASPPAARDQEKAKGAFADEDHMEMAYGGGARGSLKSPQPSSPVRQESESREKDMKVSKMQELRAKKAEKAAVPRTEVLASWSYSASGGPKKRVRADEMMEMEQQKAVSRPIPAEQSFGAPEERMDSLKEKTGQEQFLTTLIAENKADVQVTDSANIRTYSITIASGLLARFLDRLRSHGELTIIGTIPTESSSEKVTVVLQTARN
jgi:hypothetical protein